MPRIIDCGDDCYNPIQILAVIAGSVLGVLLLHGIFKIILLFCTRSSIQSTNDVASEDDRQVVKAEGLSSEVIISLPAVQFENKDKEEEEGLGLKSECPICLGGFKEGEWVRQLPGCNHGFHVVCVDVWLRTSSLCPLCRGEVLISEV